MRSPSRGGERSESLAGEKQRRVRPVPSESSSATKGVRGFRRRGTRVRASPSLRDLDPAYTLRLRSKAENGWLARYLRTRKQAEKSITRTGVTTPRGRGSAARDRARGSVRVAEIGGKSQLGEASRSSLFGGMRGRGRGLREARVIQGWSGRKIAPSLKLRQAKRRRKSGPRRIVAMGSCKRSRARAPTEGRHPRSFGSAHSSRNAAKNGLGSMDLTEPHLRQWDGNPESERDVRG